MGFSRLGLERFPYRKGLHDLGRGAYAWLAPDGSWGWSNAGLVVDGEASLLVDTLFDLALTGEMLDAMRAAEPRAAARIDVLVNTHANGDHCYGNALAGDAEIIASRASAEEMGETPPEVLAALVAGVGGQDTALGRFIRRAFGPFQFEGIRLVPPTRTFDGRLELRVGDKRVELFELGPAHTRGDVIVHVPGDGVVFTGDLLFVEGTPIVWEGPVSNWIAACDRILALGAGVLVPGHGPITDRRGPEAVKAYLEHLLGEVRPRYAAGLDAWTAARDIDLGPFAGWSDRERIVVNVDTLYRELGAREPRNMIRLFERMATYSST
jgi:glyoxylase-like metal-dependent hydrolase (beta-lactamase superfamily II)